MNRILHRGASAAALSLAFVTAAHAEDMKIKGAVGDIFGHRAVVQSDGQKYLVNFGPKSQEFSGIKTGDTISVDGDLKPSGEVRAYKVTFSDGRTVLVPKGRRTWTEWLMGDNKVAKPMFTVTEAKKLATDKGYVLQGDPVADKKHFVVNGTHDGKVMELKIFRDNRVEAMPVFAPDEAKKIIVGKGYDVVVGPDRIKDHYEALARKDSQFFEVHARRDGSVKEARIVDKKDPKWGAQIP